MRRLIQLLASTAVAVVLAAATLVCSHTPVYAQTCSFTMPSFDFGDIDLTLGTPFDLTANLSITCTGIPNSRIRYCPNIEGGSGGHLNGDPRYMLNGANQLGFNIYRNAGFSRVWGSRFWPHSNPPQPRIRLNAAGQFSGTRAVRLRIAGSQTTLPTGLYTSSFSGSHTLFAYDYFSGQNCGVIGTTNAVQVPFTVQANHVGSCSVAANNLNFGTLALLTANADATTALDVTCTAGASYQIGLNGGLSGAADPTQRKMASGANQLTYGLYQDAGRATPWGSTLGVDTVPGAGTGASQILTVFGRIPPQPTPSPATYSDTIVVTVTY